MSPNTPDDPPRDLLGAAGLAFDRIAAARGDGLLPEFRRLLSGLCRLQAGGSVTDIAACRPAAGRQSGPHPRGRSDATSAPGVLPFPDDRTSRYQKRAPGKSAGKDA